MAGAPASRLGAGTNGGGSGAGRRGSRDQVGQTRVPKRDLVTALEVVLQTGRLEVVPDCPLRAELEAELAAFAFSISAPWP